MKRLAAMGAYRLSYYLKCHDSEALIEQYKGLLSSDVSLEELRILEKSYIDSIQMENSPLKTAFRILTGTSENLIAWVALEFSLLCFMSEDVGRLYQMFYPAGNGKTCIGLVAKVLFGDEFCLQNPEMIKSAYDAVSRLFLVRKPTANRLTEPLIVDDRLLQFLGGENDISLFENPFVSVYQEDFAESQREIFQGGLLDQVSQKLAAYEERGNEKQVPMVALLGEKMSGRKYLMRRIADDRQYPLLIVSSQILGDMDQIRNILQKYLREIILTNRILCIVDVETDEYTMTKLKVILQEYEEAVNYSLQTGVGDWANHKPLFLTGDSKMKLSPFFDRFVCQVECKTPDMHQAMAAWDNFAEQYLDGRVLNSRELAAKMKLPYGKMEQIVKRLRYDPDAHPYDSKHIFRLCYELLDDGRYDNIKRVEAQYTIDDLKLDEGQKRIIRDICNQVEYRRKVMEDWNVKSRYSYGTCVSALFTGPPGTGKTMAVHVMAGILGLELYKVDVSQLVDKYIGETEKRLEEVFQRAEKSNMILFFDEADAIIGKRSEVKEANDKYANTEVSYLLQRIEEYDGIVILASNYSQNIDTAIMRRIRYTVHFSLPDEETRQEIWRSAFSPEVPQGDIDFEYLARQFEFSGGQIKNIVLNAIFLAASEESEVSMKHMVRAISLDLVKDKQVSFSREEFGEYAYLI